MSRQGFASPRTGQEEMTPSNPISEAFRRDAAPGENQTYAQCSPLVSLERQQSSLIIETERMAEDRRHRPVATHAMLFGLEGSLTTMPPQEPVPKWDRTFGPPVPYDAAYPAGRPPTTSAGIWDEFFGPPVLKGRGAKLWQQQESRRQDREPLLVTPGAQLR